MLLKIQRSQRAGGVLANTVHFCLDVRADYAPEERGNIEKYKLGSQVIYSSTAARRHVENINTQLDRTGSASMKEQAAGLARGVFSLAMAKLNLNVSIASLARGHHIECKDLEELLEAEDTLRNACKNLTRYLEVAGTFNGSEIVVAYENGEEKVHVAQNMPPLIEAGTMEMPPAEGAREARFHSDEAYDPSASPPLIDLKDITDLWQNNKLFRRSVQIIGGFVIFFIVVHALF